MLATYISLVGFDHAGKFLDKIPVLFHSKPNPMCHIPRGLIANREFALQLLCGHTLLRRANQVYRHEPLGKRNVRVVEHCVDGHTKLVLAIHALVQVTRLSCFSCSIKLGDTGSATFNAGHTARPAHTREVGDVLFFGVESLDEFEEGRLLVDDASKCLIFNSLPP